MPTASQAIPRRAGSLPRPSSLIDSHGFSFFPIALTMSALEITPISLPCSSTTGSLFILFSSSVKAISLMSASGPVVIAGEVMTSRRRLLRFGPERGSPRRCLMTSLNACPFFIPAMARTSASVIMPMTRSCPSTTGRPLILFSERRVVTSLRSASSLDFYHVFGHHVADKNPAGEPLFGMPQCNRIDLLQVILRDVHIGLHLLQGRPQVLIRDLTTFCHFVHTFFPRFDFLMPRRSLRLTTVLRQTLNDHTVILAQNE